MYVFKFERGKYFKEYDCLLSSNGDYENEKALGMFEDKYNNGWRLYDVSKID